VPQLTSDHIVRMVAYLAVLVVCLPLILILILLGVFGSKSNLLWHSDGAWLFFLVAAGVFAGMIWILGKIKTTGARTPRLENQCGSESAVADDR
jgi:hypothetical protein